MILCVDPGLTTGWMTFTPVTRTEFEIHDHGETRGEAEFEAIAWELNRQQHVSYCVCEAFIPWAPGARTWQPEALHIIGTLRFIFGINQVDLRQKAAEAKRWGTKDRRDRLALKGVRSPTGDDHAFMAAYHAGLWTMTKWVEGKPM